MRQAPATGRRVGSEAPAATSRGAPDGTAAAQPACPLSSCSRPRLSRPCVESLLCTIAEAARAARDLLPSTRRPSVPVCRSKYRDVTASTRLLLKQMQRGRLWYSKGDRPPKTARTSASAKSHSDLGAGSCHCCEVPAQQQHAPATARRTVSSPHGYRAGSPHHGRGRHLWAWVLQARFPRPHSPPTPQSWKAHTGSPPAWTAGTGVHLHPVPHRDTGEEEAAAPATEQGVTRPVSPLPSRLSWAGVSPLPSDCLLWA